MPWPPGAGEQFDEGKWDGGKWDGSPWKDVDAQVLSHHMGDKPRHFPDTRVKIAYDDTHLYLMFRVRDRYVRAVAQEDQGHVWEDSCVEFFFSPGPDIDRGYFNLEMNCGGTLLFHFQPCEGGEKVLVAPAHCERIRRWASLPRMIDPEISTPLEWHLAYALPLDIISDYSHLDRPGPGVRWRGNF
ncbi:MAG: carbohydrate-binding family 9-like protein, partial [Desulfovibrionales bacterium]|nr:carbohydrate-binding family 9-like protein [Desulfovibrionales bacterium]